jgi:hypothetical protein
VEKLWAAILEIALDPAHPENQRSIAMQPTSEHQRVQKLLVGARGGSLADYQQMVLLADEKDPVGPMAKAAITDANLFFELYRSRMYLKRGFTDPVSLKPTPLPIDEVVFQELRSPYWTQRETAVFYLAAARKNSTIPHLCDALLTETNLYVIWDITRTLNEITGSRHGALDAQSVSNWWTANIHKDQYQSPFAASQAYCNYLTLPAEQSEKAIGVLSQTIAAEPTAYWTRCFRAGCYTTLRRFDLANQDLETVGKASPRLCWYLFYRTLLQCAQGKLEQGTDSLNELLALYPSFEANARQVLPPEMLTNSKIRWPTQNKTPGGTTEAGSSK